MGRYSYQQVSLRAGAWREKTSQPDTQFIKIPNSKYGGIQPGFPEGCFHQLSFLLGSGSKDKLDFKQERASARELDSLLSAWWSGEEIGGNFAKVTEFQVSMFRLWSQRAASVQARKML